MRFVGFSGIDHLNRMEVGQSQDEGDGGTLHFSRRLAYKYSWNWALGKNS